MGSVVDFVKIAKEDNPLFFGTMQGRLAEM
jgi:hypothetical protein